MTVKILVTGATGYVASQLIPRLLERGYAVRALARQPYRLAGRMWAKQVEVVAGDVVDVDSLRRALEGVHTAYYLVHNMLSGHGYTERERVGARHFAQAAAEAGVKHIIYLGGLADPEQPLAPHLRSRLETGAILRQGRVPVTEFRAGVIIGSGSISFEMIRFTTELFPIIPGPRWLKNKVQPIAVQNVVDYLLAALENHDGEGRVFEIGGPQVTTYGDLMLCYARLRGHRRSLVLIPYLPVWLMAVGISRITPVPYPIACALIAGLSSDSIVLHPQAQEVFPEVHLMDCETAVCLALEHLSPERIERVWEDGEPGPKNLKHEGFFISQREEQFHASPHSLFPLLVRQFAHPRWQVVSQEFPQRFCVRRVERWGEKWLEWQMSHQQREVTVKQTTYFAPRGLLGFLYGWFCQMFSALTFRWGWHRILSQLHTIR